MYTSIGRGVEAPRALGGGAGGARTSKRGGREKRHANARSQAHRAQRSASGEREEGRRRGRSGEQARRTSEAREREGRAAGAPPTRARGAVRGGFNFR